MTDMQPLQGRTDPLRSQPTPPSTTIAEFDTYEEAQALVDDVADAVAAIAAFDPAQGSAAMHRPAPEDRR